MASSRGKMNFDEYLSGEKFVGEKWRNFYFLTKYLTDEIF